MSLHVIDAERLPVVAAHMVRNMRENDDEPQGPFAPYDPHDPYDAAEALEKWQKKLTLPVTDPNFGRMWGVFDDDGICRGHCDVRAQGLATMGHRVELGIGLERGVRGQGWGRKLMDLCLDFCRAEDRIRWVDLGVFAHNTGARHLYEQLGFETVGVVKERFIIGGRPVDDVTMTLFVGA